MDLLKTSILWGVPIWKVAAAATIIFLGFLSRRIIIGVFNRYLKKYAQKTETLIDDDLVELLPTPLAVASQVLLWIVAAKLLVLPREPVDVGLWVDQGLQLALAAVAVWGAFRLIDVVGRFMMRASDRTESRLDDQLVPLVRKTLKVVVALTVSVMVVQNLGYSVGSLIASLGVGGLALALAAKDTVANLFGSVVVFTDQPFQVGDWVEFAGNEGTVEEVGFRTTRVRRFDKSLITVPNQMFSTTPITNHSSRPLRRLDLSVGLTYETKPDEVRAVLDDLRKLVAEHDAIDDTFSFVKFTQLGDFALVLRVYCFSKSTAWMDYLSLQEELLLRIMEIVAKNGVEMAFPTQTLYVRDEQWPSRTTTNPR